ncbi:MAG: DUF4426 domain-containing protein [Gammaproteobacteria bacterium]|nr:DUF4426 domain-containing protein [Gammaproteobacteria bacterium]MBT5054761.1 DUF4426 domain-containing protein [Gammaproteobacteria bacterium]
MGFNQTMIRLAIIGIIALLISTEAAAEQKIQVGEFEIHYTAFPSLLVPADTANLHGLTRAENRLLLNLSVRRIGEPVPARVTGQVVNILNQAQPLTFFEVSEQTAIYYLAEVVNQEKDWLRFTLEIEFSKDHPPYVLEFNRQYY